MIFNVLPQKMILEAQEVFFDPKDDIGCVTVGFKSAGDDYVLLTRNLNPDDQDISLGMEGVHLEINDQGWSGYDAVASFAIYPEKVDIQMTAKGATTIGRQQVEIRYSLPADRRAQLRTTLRTLFEGFSNFADVG